MTRENEILTGKIKFKPDVQKTRNDHVLCRNVLIEVEQGEIPLVAWDDLAEILQEKKPGDEVVIEGYRKYNDYEQREQFVIMGFGAKK